MPFIRLVFICLFSLPLAVSLQAQDKPANVPSLDDAKTMEDIDAYREYMFEKADTGALSQKAAESVRASIFIPAGNKLQEIAKNVTEKLRAYNLKYSGLICQVRGEDDKQKIKVYLDEFEAFLDEIDSKENALKEEALKEGVSEFFAERFESWQGGRYFLFLERAKIAETSPKTFDQFKAGFKVLINHPSLIGFIPDRTLTAHFISMGLPIAARNNVPAEQFIKEMSEYIQSSQCTIPEARKEQILADLEIMTRIEIGIDPKLYGRTLDDKDFDRESLRGKYVLIKFTATWCEPCKRALPDMLEAYKKYHDKGLEIVSIYIGQNEPDPVATVKESVEKEKLPWIIISEALTEKAGQPKQSEYYRVDGVPNIMLMGKEGKIIMFNRFSGMGGTHPDGLNAKLAKIFE
jgi:thiol-disulfide isomerase/thioredoxin